MCSFAPTVGRFAAGSRAVRTLSTAISPARLRILTHRAPATADSRESLLSVPEEALGRAQTCGSSVQKGTELVCPRRNSATRERVGDGVALTTRPLILSMGGGLEARTSPQLTAPLRQRNPNMQLPILPIDAQLAAVLRAVHDDRIDRFLPAAQGSREDAFSLYLWNCSLCEAFYLPLHFAEISVRNAINNRLIERFGERWFENRAVVGTLEPRRQAEFSEILQSETRRHGAGMTCHHLVSEMSFGFWQHLLTKRFNRIIWADGMHCAFPNLPNALGRQEVHDRIEVVRKWRNRIAHHKPIFDKGPSAKLQETLQLIHWVCHDVANWVTSATKVTVAIQLRPVART